ncbi:hypothetical protein ACF0H5_021169 [Mactra antiquata]
MSRKSWLDEPGSCRKIWLDEPGSCRKSWLDELGSCRKSWLDELGSCRKSWLDELGSCRKSWLDEPGSCRKSWLDEPGSCRKSWLDELDSCRKIWLDELGSCRKIWLDKPGSCRKSWLDQPGSCRKIWLDEPDSCRKSWLDELGSSRKSWLDELGSCRKSWLDEPGSCRKSWLDELGSCRKSWLDELGSSGQDCSFPSTLWGQWSSSNLGTINITGGTPSLSFTKIFTGQTGSGNSFNCKYKSGTRYVLQATTSFAPFSGTSEIFMWICMDLRQASLYSYYYYLQTEQEPGFENYRIAGLPGDSSVNINDICTTTLDTAEFNTMIKIGQESEAISAVQCSIPLLGRFLFTYSDDTHTSVSSNTSYITSCDQYNRTHIFSDTSGLTGVQPFYSVDGLVGCIVNIYDSATGIYYTSLYNLDTSPTTEFICVASNKDSTGRVYLSTKQTDCETGQSPTVQPTNGALLELTPSCIPPTHSTSRSLIWMILLLICLCLLIILIILFVCLHIRLKSQEKSDARKKKTINQGNHPLGEMSLPLDAPPSMNRQSYYIDDDEDLLTRRRQSGQEKNILGEQSLNLNLDFNQWSHIDKQPSMYKLEKTRYNGMLGKRRMTNNKVPTPREMRRSETYKSQSSRSNIVKSSMLEKKLSNSKPTGLTRSITQIKSGSSSKSIRSSSRPTSSKKNGIHPAPHRPSSRPSSSRSRRGSIDNLVIDRSIRALSYKRPQRSNTMILSSRDNESDVNSPSNIKPKMITMPEEYQIQDGPNQLIPEIPSTLDNLHKFDTNRSLRTFRNTGNRLMKPNATRSSWR